MPNFYSKLPLQHVSTEIILSHFRGHQVHDAFYNKSPGEIIGGVYKSGSGY